MILRYFPALAVIFLLAAHPAAAQDIKVGLIAGMSGPDPAVYWGGHIKRLPQPPGGKGEAGSNATSISDDGQVIGGQTNLGNKVVAVEWRCH